MFGTSGIRGPVGEAVDARLAVDVGRGVASEADKVVVGRDVRETGAVLADALSAGLRECGTDVIRLGIVSTPTLARSVRWFGADAGVGITASHNPASDNGIKLWNPSGQAFTPAQTDAIEERLDADDAQTAPWDEFGTERPVDDASARHVDQLVATVTESDSLSATVSESDLPESVTSKASPFEGLTIVVDLGNGTGRVTVDALYELGATVHTLDGQPDGRFPARKSEPNAETLGALRSAVPALDADLGIAHDGDADRMVAVTAEGEYVPGDVLLALFARDAVDGAVPSDPESARAAPDTKTTGTGTGPARVAVPVDTSLLVADAVTEVGGEVAYTPVGDVHVAEAVSREGFVFGGEPSGAWIWPEQTLAPDGHLAALRLVSLLARRGSLDGLLDALPTDAYVTRRENIPVEDRSASMEAVERELRDRYNDIDSIDGLRVETDDGWFLVRPSGTEPLVRVTAEAREDRAADELLESALDVVSANAVR
ncbi:phosphoglucosamine mutase [Halobellus rufus]|uniref:phosphoglucosamine mutase n=1 Tax=Halobellus rufus TaxID=1448860 RepID=UPI000679CE97|nr:phosphoglucosamine mutase [Halobellus rufus]